MDQYVFNKQTNENTVMPEGDYEVKIERIEKRVTGNGKEKLSVMYRVRQDVEQQYKNKCLFEDIWAEKENPQYFNRKRLNQLLGTQDIEEGRVFAGINAIIEFLTGCNLQVHVTTEFNDYKGQDDNVVQYYKSSGIKNQTVGTTTTTTKKDNEVVIPVDELPF